jgi:hypothetical protein
MTTGDTDHNHTSSSFEKHLVNNILNKGRAAIARAKLDTTKTTTMKRHKKPLCQPADAFKTRIESNTQEEPQYFRTREIVQFTPSHVSPPTS